VKWIPHSQLIKKVPSFFAPIRRKYSMTIGSIEPREMTCQYTDLYYLGLSEQAAVTQKTWLNHFQFTPKKKALVHFYGQKVVKGFKFAHFYVLSMGKNVLPRQGM
jgi:hypothetical protein